MSVQKTPQDLINDVINTANALARVIEDFYRKSYREGDTQADLKDTLFGYSDAQIVAKLTPRVKTAFLANKAALAALKAQIIADIDPTVT